MDPDFLEELVAYLEARDERDARRARDQARPRETARRVKGGAVRRIEH